MGYQRLATTFPMGWYGQLAARRRAQLGLPLFFGGQLADDGLGSTAVRVGPRPTLISLYSSSALVSSRTPRAPQYLAQGVCGAERPLGVGLSSTGEDDRADSMLVRRGVLFVVRPDQRKLYETIFLRYQKHLKAAARVARIPASMLAALVYVESRFNPAATSGVRRSGLHS